MKQMICWVTKTHEKNIKKYFLKNTQVYFFRNLDELFLHKNSIIVISLSKITSEAILDKIKKLNHPYFLEKKGWITYTMTKALESSKNHFMIGISDIQVLAEDIQ